MKWIKGHKLISFILAIIIITLVVLITSVLSGGKGNPVSNFFGTVLNTIEKPFASAGNGISSTVSGMFSYGDLKKQIDELEEENAKLKEQITNLTLSANQLQELQNLQGALGYKDLGSSGKIVSGDVISMDGTNWMNIFTINVGKESGIQEGNIVINGDGLVGRVGSTGRGWSKVVSIIDESAKISFKIEGNLSLMGITEASKDGEIDGFMLDSTATVSEGDKLITSGMGTYPAGIQIGKITKVRYDSNSQLERVTVKPTVNFTSLQKVSVLI